MIEYRNIHKAFDVPVLAGLSLTVETGEILGILGPSGTGKSVLLKTTDEVVARPTPSAPPRVSKPMWTEMSGMTKPKASAFIKE